MKFVILSLLLGFAWTAQAQSTLTFSASADAYVNSGSSSANYGSASRLLMDLSPDFYSYLKFQVQGVSGTIESAKLRLYVVNSSSNAAEVYSTSSSWSESTINWSNKPAAISSLIADKGSASSGVYVEYDVKAAIQGDGTYSFLLKPDSSDGFDVSSRESTHKPQLVISYSGGTSAADTIAPSVSITSPASGAVLSGVVTLAASASDNVGVASVEFRWDGQLFAAADTSAPFSYTWDTTKSGDDFYTLTAVAKDAAGNVATSSIVTVTVRNAVVVNPTPTPSATPAPVSGGIRRVPQDYSTIQGAINAAAAGDIVLVSPGTYTGGLVISKAITLASLYATTGTRSYIDQTIIQSGSPIINIAASAANAKVIGITFKGGTKGVQCFGYCEVYDNKFMTVGNDAMSLEDVGGIIKNNYFDNAGDDCIDLDGPMTSLIEGNFCNSAGDDGLELRNFDYSGSMATITIRSNTFKANDEDGIQLIDYSATSNRKFIIDHNLLSANRMVGLGLMDNGNTIEDYHGASMPERIVVTNNTIVGNTHGITGGDNLIAVNNIIANNSVLGLKAVDNKSIASYNIMFGNGSDYSASNVNLATIILSNALLSADFHLQAGSPAIDAGVASFTHNGEVIFSMPSNFYNGVAPDLGAYESGSASVPVPTATPVATPVPTATPVATPVPTATPVATPIATPVPTATSVIVSSGSYSDDTFSSLKGSVQVLSKDYGYSQLRLGGSADGQANSLDMRLSKFVVANSKNSNPTYAYDCTQGSLPIQTYPMIIDNMDFTSIVGGMFNGDLIPQKSDWRPSYCNSAVVSFRNTPSGIADGIRITGGWDGIRQAEGSSDLLITNTWMTNVRDDGVENDFLNNLTLRDVLLDGLFQGISTRPSSTNTVGDSSAHTITISGAVIRLQPYLIEGKYGYGALFKTRVSGAPKSHVYNTVFAVEPEDGVLLSTTNWPQGWKDMSDCKGNVFLWMSDRAMPSSSDMGTIPSCFTVVKGQAARDMYNKAKTNWINCHPKVARGTSDPSSDINQCRANEYGGFGN